VTTDTSLFFSPARSSASNSVTGHRRKWVMVRPSHLGFELGALGEREAAQPHLQGILHYFSEPYMLQ
jgi:hypothetical protein